MIILQLTTEELAATIEEAVAKALRTYRPQQEEAPPELLTVDQTAEWLNLSKHTLYGLTCRNEIPHSKRGKRLYFRREELLAWIAEGKRKTQAEIEAEAVAYVSPQRRAA